MLLLSLVLAAGGLDDAKAALTKLEAPKAVRGELKVMRWQRVSGGDKPAESSAGVTFHVSESGSGVSMQCTQGMLSDKAQNIVGTTTLMRVHKLLDARAELLKQLEHAQVLSEEAATWKGQSCRHLKFKADLEALQGEKGEKAIAKSGVSVDLSNGTAGLWIDENGVPLASELGGDIEAGVMMLKMKNHSHVQREYAVVGNRLVVTHESEETDTDAVGHGLQVKQTTELTVSDETRSP
jgi:hypothetical protein